MRLRTPKSCSGKLTVCGGVDGKGANNSEQARQLWELRACSISLTILTPATGEAKDFPTPQVSGMIDESGPCRNRREWPARVVGRY